MKFAARTTFLICLFSASILCAGSIVQNQSAQLDTTAAEYNRLLEIAKKASPEKLTVMIQDAKKAALDLNLEAQCAQPFCAEGSPLDQECTLASKHLFELEVLQKNDVTFYFDK